MTITPTATPSEYFVKLMRGNQLCCCVYVLSKLNIPELIQQSEQHVNDLAAITNTHARSLYRVLRTVASEGIFEETSPGRFKSTPLSAALLPNAAGSMKAYIEMLMGEHYQSMGNLMHAVLTGETSFDNYYKMDLWAFYSANPELGIVFNRAMEGLSQFQVQVILPAYDFSPYNKIIDVGGGSGSLLLGILEANPQVTGVVYDQPQVLLQTGLEIERHGLQERCSTIGGDFFTSVPPDFDLYILKHIVHDWNETDNIRLLANCAAGMHADSRLLVIDPVIPIGNAYHGGKYTDIFMLTLTKGQERTVPEFEELATAAGLEITRVIHLATDLISIVEMKRKA